MVSSEDELKELRNSFMTMDNNGDGVLDFDELSQGFGQDHNLEEIKEIFNNMDMDKNGFIEYTEFLAAMMDHRKIVNDDTRLIQAFKHLDADNSGFIEHGEIMKIVGTNNSKVASFVLNSIDTNGDGRIS